MSDDLIYGIRNDVDELLVARDSLAKKISELENVLKTLNMDNKAYKIAQEHNWLVYKDKLNELEKRFVEMQVASNDNSANFQKQIDELKEHREIQLKYNTNIFNDVNNNREVLRELIQQIIGDGNYYWNVDFENEPYNKLLAKLDGKDSGGDYTGMIYGEDQIAMEQEQGEKPPETSENDCKSCKYYISHVECEKECLYYTDGQKLISEFVDADKNWINYLNLLIKNYNDSPLKENLYTLRDEIIKDFEKWEAKTK